MRLWVTRWENGRGWQNGTSGAAQEVEWEAENKAILSFSVPERLEPPSKLVTRALSSADLTPGRSEQTLVDDIHRAASVKAKNFGEVWL
jgi:hypothetical protein